jgi:hypothetical protein
VRRLHLRERGDPVSWRRRNEVDDAMLRVVEQHEVTYLERQRNVRNAEVVRVKVMYADGNTDHA